MRICVKIIRELYKKFDKFLNNFDHTGHSLMIDYKSDCEKHKNVV